MISFANFMIGLFVQYMECDTTKPLKIKPGNPEAALTVLY